MYAEQAVEVTLPIGAPYTLALVAATSSASIDLTANVPGLVGPPYGQFVLMSCTAAWTVRSGSADPGPALSSDFPLQANTVYRFKITPQTFVARFFSTAGGTLSVALSSR